MNVGEQIEALELMPEDAEVRLASQPTYPFQHTVAGVVAVEPDEEDEYGGTTEEDGPVVYVVEGGSTTPGRTCPAPPSMR